MLEVKDLHLTLAGHSIIRGISLHVAAGEVLTLLGPSGSGKSSLLRCIARLEQPDAGVMTLEGAPLDTLPAYSTGLIFQSFHLFNHLTLLENVVLAAVKVRSMATAKARAQALHLLESLGLVHRAHAYPGRVSGGEKQRASIARALMMDPPILLLDEPTSALDPELVGTLAQLMRTLSTKARAIIMATHDMHFAKAASDHVAFLAQGRVIERAPATSFFARPKTEQARAFLKGCLL